MARPGIRLAPRRRLDRCGRRHPPGQGFGGVTAASAGIKELEEASQSFRKGQFDEALKQLQQAVTAHPELPPARFLLGMLFLSANQLPQGRALMEQGAAEAPAHPDIPIAFGKLALAEGRLHDAQLNFERAATLADSGAWKDEQKTKFRSLIHEGLGTVAEARNDFGRGREELTAWLELDPKHGRARQRLGRALFLRARPTTPGPPSRPPPSSTPSPPTWPACAG